MLYRNSRLFPVTLVRYRKRFDVLRSKHRFDNNIDGSLLLPCVPFFSEVRQLHNDMQVSCEFFKFQITFQLSGQVYHKDFGISGSDVSSQMVGFDVAVTRSWVTP